MYTYLALGDSYTIGESVPKGESFPYQTAAQLRKQSFDIADPVIIAATGWTTAELAASIREHNLHESFSIVSLLIGVNNQYRGLDINEYSREFSQLLDQAIIFANGHSRHIFVLSIPDWGVTPFAAGRDAGKISLEIDAYNKVNRDITESHKCHYLDITDSTRVNGSNPEFLAHDGLHPSGREYGVWAGRLAALIAKALKQ